MEISKDSTIAITFTAAELFALQAALQSAGASADDERKAQQAVADDARHDAMGRRFWLAAAEDAALRSSLYWELASRIGHRAGELPEDVPAGFGSFPRRGDGGAL